MKEEKKQSVTEIIDSLAIQKTPAAFIFLEKEGLTTIKNIGDKDLAKMLVVLLNGNEVLHKAFTKELESFLEAEEPQEKKTFQERIEEKQKESETPNP